jgi:hypothetical protein
MLFLRLTTVKQFGNPDSKSYRVCNVGDSVNSGVFGSYSVLAIFMISTSEAIKDGGALLVPEAYRRIT